MREERCIKCGKIFIPAANHIYKDHRGFYCSWTCYNHRDDNTPYNRSRGVAQCSLDGEVIRTFLSAVFAAEFIKGTVNGVRKACKESTLYKGYFWRYI